GGRGVEEFGATACGHAGGVPVLNGYRFCGQQNQRDFGGKARSAWGVPQESVVLGDREIAAGVCRRHDADSRGSERGAVREASRKVHGRPTGGTDRHTGVGELPGTIRPCVRSGGGGIDEGKLLRDARARGECRRMSWPLTVEQRHRIPTRSGQVLGTCKVGSRLKELARGGADGSTDRREPVVTVRLCAAGDGEEFFL